MANKDLNEKLLQEPLSEDEIDELRANGQGFERSAKQASREDKKDHARESAAPFDPGDEAERLMVGESPSDDPRSYKTPKDHQKEAPGRPAGLHGGTQSAAGHKGLLAMEGHDPDRREMTGDESLTEQERAAGKFETEGQPTQLEQDFGEIGRNMRGSIHDSAHEPSILDPDEE